MPSRDIIPPLLDVQGDTLRLNFHPGQWRAWQSERRVVCVLGGTQSGKSSLGPPWLNREIQRRGPGDYLVAAPTYPLLSLKALPEFLRYFGQLLRLGAFTGSPIRRFTFSPEGCLRTFGRVPDVSTNIFFGHASDPDSLEAATAKAAWLDEAGQPRFRLESYEAVQRRLAVHQGRILITTTPYNLGWLKTHIYDRWKSGDTDIDVIQFDSTANPAFPQEEWERAQEALPAWRFNLYYKARFDRPAGLVYDCFDPERDIVPPFTVPPHWPRYLGLDFGGVNTAAVFYAAEPGTPNLYAYREYHAGGRTARQHVEALLAGEVCIPTCVGGSRSEGQWRDEFRAAGLPVREPDITSVELGIARVYGAHKAGVIHVFRTLTRYLAELGSYSYKVDEHGNSLGVLDNKAAFHMCFVAGTLVTTDQGAIPIEDVVVGMQALTRQGFRRITAARSTAYASVREVLLSNGQILVGTGDHPIWVRGKGFVAIDALRYNDFVLYQEDFACEEKPGSSMGLRTTATQTRSDGPTRSTLNIRAPICIESSGSKLTVLFRRAITFITWMETQATTLWKTFCLSPLRATLQSITPLVPSRLSVRPICAKWFALLRPSGTARRKGGNGIENTAPVAGRRGSLSNINANAVGVPTHHEVTGVFGFAPMPVVLPTGASKDAITSSGTVSSAVRGLSGTATPGLVAAPVCVHHVRAAGRATVYNLTVDEVHEYFANGVLVSNCDASRYIVGWLRRERQPGLAAAAGERPNPGEFRPELLPTAPPGGWGGTFRRG